MPLEKFFQLDMDKRTKGHSARLKKSRCNTELRRHFFSERVVNSRAGKNLGFLGFFFRFLGFLGF